MAHARSVLLAALAAGAAALSPALPAVAQETPASMAAVNTAPAMNVFRRYAEENEAAMFAFYEEAVGLERLGSFTDVGAGGVHRFRAGRSELKMTRRVPDRSYVPGAVDAATGVRLFSIRFPDEAALVERFEAAGLEPPAFEDMPGTDHRAALVTDPDGQMLELVVVPDATEEELGVLEVGLTVSDLEASRAFYRDFAGLEELEPVDHALTGTTKHPFRHGFTVVSLRTFEEELPADTGSGGIQYVVADAALAETLAVERGYVIDQPLSTLPGSALTTIWIDDPDGITNYFAQVGGPPGSPDAGD